MREDVLVVLLIMIGIAGGVAVAMAETLPTWFHFTMITLGFINAVYVITNWIKEHYLCK